MKGNFLTIILLVSYCLSQDFTQISSDPIQGFTVTPQNNKMRISANYYYSDANKLFDSDGDVWKNGDLMIEKNATGDTVSMDTIKFSFKQNILNIHLDYMGSYNIGLYLNAPLTINRKINSISVGESGLGDLSFGIYTLWEEFFKIQRIKTGAFYKRAKSGIPGDLEVHYTGTGQNSIGFFGAMDILISEKMKLSLIQVTTFNGETAYPNTATGDSILVNPFTAFDFNLRTIYNFYPQISLGLDYTYNSFASILKNNTLSTGFISGIKPMVGYNMFSDFSIGYLNIESFNIVGSWSITLNGKSSYKQNIIQLGTQFHFN